MGRAWVPVILACLASCYQAPSLASCKYRCGGANNDACPSGYECTAGMCVAPGEACGSDGGVVDAAPDGAEMSSCTQWELRDTLATMPGPSQLVAFEADAGGTMDLAVLEGGSTVGVYLGTGDGTFGLRAAADSAADAVRILAGDFDRDGSRDDLVVLRAGASPQLTLLKRQPSGAYSRTIFPIPGAPADLARLGDINGDTYEDIVVLDAGNLPQLRIYTQTTMVANWTAGTSTATGSAGRRIVTGALGPDEPIDAAVLRSDQTQFVAHLGDGATPFSFAAARPDVIAGTPSAATIARLDGVPAVALAIRNSNTVVLREVGRNTFIDRGSLPVGAGPVAILAADLAGSDEDDLVTANEIDRSLSVIIRRTSSWEPAGRIPVTGAPIDVVAGDFDTDTRTDLAVLTPESGTIQIFLNRCSP